MFLSFQVGLGARKRKRVLSEMLDMQKIQVCVYTTSLNCSTDVGLSCPQGQEIIFASGGKGSVSVTQLREGMLAPRGKSLC
jgi:hypothetical protein